MSVVQNDIFIPDILQTLQGVRNWDIFDILADVQPEGKVKMGFMSYQQYLSLIALIAYMLTNLPSVWRSIFHFAGKQLSLLVQRSCCFTQHELYKSYLRKAGVFGLPDGPV